MKGRPCGRRRTAVVTTEAGYAILYIAPPAWALAGAFVSETMVLAACWIVIRSIFIPKTGEFCAKHDAFV